MKDDGVTAFPLLAGFPLLLGFAILWLAGLGAMFQALADMMAAFTGDDTAAMLYRRIGLAVGWKAVDVRLFLLMPVHLVGLIVGWPIFKRVFWLVRWMFTKIARLFSSWTRVKRLVAGVSWLCGAAVALAFVVQPGLVGLELTTATSKARLANLLDGTASLETYGMLHTLHRKIVGAPIPRGHALTQVVSGLDSPMMSRWDPLLKQHTDSDLHYAQTKAFMWVESAGRQWAVSRTGCSGLYQFCVGTAKRRPFREIFGPGNISACTCGGKPCSVPKDLRDSLEKGGTHDARFPCDPTDARFDPARAIPAGAAFVTELSDDVEGNLAMMYIGYNSGPAVAKKLHEIVGEDATIEDLRPHLATVLRRWYGDRATARANGLLNVHLPKLQAACDHYRP